MGSALHSPSGTGPQLPRDPGEHAGLRRGDHIRAGYPRTAHHDGIYLGNELVIHLTGGTPDGRKAAARVRMDSLAQFAYGRPVTVRPYSGAHEPEDIVVRAVSRLGKGNYNLIFNKCQHFALVCDPVITKANRSARSLRLPEPSSRR